LHGENETPSFHVSKIWGFQDTLQGKKIDAQTKEQVKLQGEDQNNQ
jgi:hypothetical protein